MAISRYIRSKTKKMLARTARENDARQPVVDGQDAQGKGGGYAQDCRLRRTLNDPIAGGGCDRKDRAEFE